MMPYLKRQYLALDSNIFPWEVYTDKDLQLEASKWEFSKTSESQSKGKVHCNFCKADHTFAYINFNFFLLELWKQYARKVGSNNPKECLKSSIVAIIDRMKRHGKLEELTRAVVFVQKAGGNPHEAGHRYFIQDYIMIHCDNSMKSKFRKI